MLVVVVAGVAAASADWQAQDKPQSCASPDQAEVEGLTMSAPAPGTMVAGDSVAASGTVDLVPGERVWVLLHAVIACKYYLVSPVEVSGGTWKSTLYVDPSQQGAFGAYVVVVQKDDDNRLHELAAAGGSQFIEQLPANARAVHVSVRCCS